MPIVTELTIDSSGATRGASEYSRAMDSAASAAQRGLGAISDVATRTKDSIVNLGAAAGSLTPSITVMAVGVTAASAAFIAGFEAVKKFSAGLAEMSLSAKRANLDVETFQQLQFVVGAGGVSGKDFSTGAEKLAANLSEARREENDMSKLLDANNVKWKDGNKLILDTNGLLNVARDLIHRAADEQQKIKMADMLGLTKEWVPALDMSAQAFAKLQNESTALGLVINKDIIAKATEFDAEWRKSSLVFSTWMKAKLADLLPLLDQLISKASDLSSSVMSSLDAAAKSPAGQEFTARSNRASFIFEMLSSENDAKENADIVVAAGKAMAGTLSETTTKLIDQQLATRGLAKFWNDYASSMGDATTAAEKFIKSQPTGANDNKAKASVLPPKSESDDARDAWDRAVSALDKHIGRMQADTLAVGQSAAAQAALRAEFSLLEAAQIAEKDVTDEQIAKYAQFRASMSATQALTAAGIKLDEDDVTTIKKKSEATLAATAVLEKAKIASDISRGRQTALLSPDDVAIAEKLKAIYPDVTTALGSSEAAALRLNGAIREGHENALKFVDTLVQGLFDARAGTDSVSKGFEALAKSLASTAIKQLLSGDFEKAAVSAISATISWITSLFTHTQNLKDQIALIDKVSALQTRQIAATTDQSTLAGQLASFDAQANIQRMMEARDGNKAIGELELTLSEERLKIIKDFNAQALSAAQQAADAQEQVMKAAQQRIQSAQDRLFNATNDPNTLEGQLAAFDRQAQADQLAERDAGGQAMLALEAAQAQERLNIIKGYNQKITDAATQAAQQQLDAVTKAARGIVDYLNNLNVGADSSLSPQARLAAAQSTYNAKLGLAQGGNADALSSITTDAENLRKAAQDFFASGSGYQNILATIKAQLLALPAVAQSTDPVVAAVRDVVAAVTTGATTTTAAIGQTNALTSVSNNLQDTANGLALVANSILATQQSLLSAINTLSDRDVNAINGLGVLTASIASTHSSQFNTMISLLGAIASRPTGGGGTLWSWLGFQQGGMIPGYAGGGMIANGIWNRDSVIGRYAGGGDIALAGGEYVTRAPSVNASTLPTLRYMNDNGRPPANDNGFDGRGVANLTRVSAAGSSAIVAALREEIGALREEIARGNATARLAKDMRPRPGAPQAQKSA